MRKLVIAVASVLALAVVAVSPVAAQPVGAPPPPLPGRALLVQQVQTDHTAGHVEVVPWGLVLDVDGTLRRLAPGFARDPSWSPDGSQVAYRSAGDDVRLIARDGSGDRLVLADAVLSAEPWTPDGAALLAIRYGAGDDGTLLLVDVETGGVRAEVAVEGDAVGPVLSPDGAHIAFGRVAAQADQSGLWVVGVDGTGLRQLTAAATTGAWLPDGSGLAAVTLEEDGERAINRLVVARLDRTAVVVEAPEPAGNDQVPVVSPDGTRLAYSACADGCATTQAVVVTLDGVATVVPPVVHGSAVRPLSWLGADRLLATESAFPDGEGLFLVAHDIAAGTAEVLSGPLGPLLGATAAPGEERPPHTATVARALWWSRQLPTGAAGTVLLGRADSFADSLASGGAQGALDAPILLTPGDRLDPAVADELARLGASDVVLLGGTAALSEGVEGALAERGYATSRVEGPTRLETAVAVAEGFLPAPHRILLVRGFGDPESPTRGFADSLAAGAAAAALGSPLLLTDTTSLSPAVEAYLDRTPSLEEVVVIGGEAAVGSAVGEALSLRGLAVIRIAGPERRATAAAVARFVREADAGDDSPPPTGGTYMLVDAEDELAWADGSAVARLADGAQGGGVLLADEVLSQPTMGVLVDAVGGSSVACASLVAERVCRDAAGVHATAQPEELAVADLGTAEVVADARLQRMGIALCTIVTAEGVELVGAQIEGFGSLPSPGDGGRIVSCHRSILHVSTITQLLEAGAEVVATTADGTELRGTLERVEPTG